MQEEASETVEVEIRDHKGDVVRSYQATEQEERSIPMLMQARHKLQTGDPMGAFEALVQVCHSTNTNVLEVIDNAKDKYEEEQSQLTQEDIERKQSFLSEQGNENILRAAYTDGSSKLCCHCNALINIKRYDIHISHWCPAIHSDID